MNQEQEEAFVKAFITPDKQERYLLLLAHPKRRKKVLADLYHSLPVIPTRLRRLTGKDHSHNALEATLKQKGAGATCYVISPRGDLDQREMLLHEALKTIIGEDATAVVCCIVSRLAYYKAEQEGFLLESDGTIL